MATESAAGAVITGSADVGLKREMGLIGAIWASETSIIGSGWLFGSLYAAQAAGTAALLAWAIAGVIVIIIALVHAELDAMYPVAGGTARFPHFAFGSVAGISFGFFSWLRAVTVAPIECFAVMQYAQFFSLAASARYPGPASGRWDEYIKQGVGRTLILHWNGSTWAHLPSPPPGTGSNLSGVAASSAFNAWAVGMSGGATVRTLTVRCR